TPMSARRPWIRGAGAAIVATAAVIVAMTVVGNNGSPSPSAGPAAGSGPSRHAVATPTQAVEPSASASQPATSVSSQTVPVYYVGDTSHGPRLYREFHQVTTGDPLSAALSEAVGTTVDGGQSKPLDPDYRVPWPAGTTASGSTDGDTITVDLSGSVHDRPAGMSEDEAKIAVQQLVYTAQAATQSTAPVQLLLNGQHTDTVLGVPASEPLARGDETDVLAQFWIISPQEGETVTSPVKVSGLAAAFEANVPWELKQGDRVVKKGFTTAKECCTMAPYSFTVQAPPGDYTLVVHDSDPSGQGNAPWTDTKDITIQ
ncbi:MAG: Gmad2 immunoglobulin-like domain-containing protein, partial [Nocardioidaceae bacterium]